MVPTAALFPAGFRKEGLVLEVEQMLLCKDS
jgi:hypothetical protein